MQALLTSITITMNPNKKSKKRKTVIGILFHLIALSLVYGPLCYALSFARNKKQRKYRTTTTTLQAQDSSQDLTDAISSDSIFSQIQDTEFWLDLRRTAFHPKAAIDEIETQLGRTLTTSSSSSSSSPPLVNQILLSENMSQNLINSNDPYIATAPILYQSSKNDTIFSLSSQGLSTPFGSLISTPSDATVPAKDPIQAIQMITDGKWLLLGKKEGEEDDLGDLVESMRIESVGNFLDIVSTAAAPELGITLSETKRLVLPKPKRSTQTTSNLQEEGGLLRNCGVAVTCSTKSAILKLAFKLQLMMKPGTMNSVTDSGIIIETNVEESSPTATLTTAVVIPFDVNLWKIGTLMFKK
mmetsp:Transcript_41628/g.45175  ORF Transcript_41628/g.45175 Transcript_41628/m.45175 type:complete len:356 (-) Transcript_41628:1145-2212(-)